MTISKPYILLVEDNPDDVELTMLAFKKNNFTNEIQVVEDGEEALDFFLEIMAKAYLKEGCQG